MFTRFAFACYGTLSIIIVFLFILGQMHRADMATCQQTHSEDVCAYTLR